MLKEETEEEKKEIKTVELSTTARFRALARQRSSGDVRMEAKKEEEESKKKGDVDMDSKESSDKKEESKPESKDTKKKEGEL